MNVLIIPRDIPESNRPDLDGYGEPLFSDLWYWAEELRDEGEPFFLIVSGPVSPLTLARR